MNVFAKVGNDIKGNQNMSKHTKCIFEKNLADGKITWYMPDEEGFMANILGDLNKDRFIKKGYIIAKKGLTSNYPSIIFPNKDRDAGELIRTFPNTWSINASVFFEVYPELRNIPRCRCEDIH